MVSNTGNNYSIHFPSITIFVFLNLLSLYVLPQIYHSFQKVKIKINRNLKIIILSHNMFYAYWRIISTLYIYRHEKNLQFPF